MELKRHHKWIIGSFSSLIIIYMIANSIFLYSLFLKEDINYNSLQQSIKNLQIDTQTKINQLTANIIETKDTLNTINTSLKSELKELKASASSDFSGIIENSINSVVTIRTDVSQGTGFIINDDGYLVTNAHVLVRGTKISIITANQDLLKGNLIGYNNDFDIALIKINGNYNSLKFADSDEIQVGEKVIAIGNPLGLQFSVSEGIVSGIHREGLNGVNSYVQTDAALNPGNSGGPLINKQGEVIGINNFKIGGSENIGFALESNYIKEVVNEISNRKLNQTLA